VEVRWPGGMVERFVNLPVDRIHTVKEGSGEALPAETKKPD
jgi:hypothetical protein